jgi:hypothetical protein
MPTCFLLVVAHSTFPISELRGRVFQAIHMHLKVCSSGYVFMVSRRGKSMKEGGWIGKSVSWLVRRKTDCICMDMRDMYIRRKVYTGKIIYNKAKSRLSEGLPPPS